LAADLWCLCSKAFSTSVHFDGEERVAFLGGRGAERCSPIAWISRSRGTGTRWFCSRLRTQLSRQWLWQYLDPKLSVPPQSRTRIVSGNQPRPSITGKSESLSDNRDTVCSGSVSKASSAYGRRWLPNQTWIRSRHKVKGSWVLQVALVRFKEWRKVGIYKPYGEGTRINEKHDNESLI